MAEISQFGSLGPDTRADARTCAQFEALLADAVDGVLSPEQQEFFDEHAKGCASCGVLLAEAERGAAWLATLKAYPPEPAYDLVERILAETAALRAADDALVVAERRAHAQEASLLGTPGVPARDLARGLPSASKGWRSRLSQSVQPLTHTVLQPRFMLTAAMAFFSIALTLNVTGVHLNELHASDLKPAALRRSFYQANAHVVRYYDNLRVVYELESRVHDLQHGADSAAPVYPAGQGDPKQQDRPDVAPGDTKPADKGPDGAKSQHPDPKAGSSRREMPRAPVSLAAYVCTQTRLDDAMRSMS